MKTKPKWRQLGIGLAFLSPSIIGFLCFTLIPLVLSLLLAFSNWDLRFHNRFHHRSLQFVGLDNFHRLLVKPDFWRFLGNTFVFMLGIPISIFGSLLLALMLSGNLAAGSRRGLFILILIAVGVAAVEFFSVLATGGQGSGMETLLTITILATIIAGLVGGSVIYRTLLYLPSFTSGVAIFLLWKKLYSPHTGPINYALAPCLNLVSDANQAMPLWCHSLLPIACATGVGGCLIWGVLKLVRLWRESEISITALCVCSVLAFTPVMLSFKNEAFPLWSSIVLAVAGVAVLIWQISKRGAHRDFFNPLQTESGPAIRITLLVMLCGFMLLLVGAIGYWLDHNGAGPLQPPNWLTDYQWAKPAMVIIGIWAAIGSNNMLLYLAGLSNIPAELYEAAELDGAGARQKFWQVTWPHLAPTTFFIVVMSIIAGLQGGFEMARSMTNGGPAGSTTSLAYYIYTEGFETGRMGYSCAISWLLFLMIAVITAFNWKFGRQYVED